MVQRLAMSNIRRDGGTQIRVALDRQTVEDYAQAIRDGEKLPPAVVFHDNDDLHWLADGFHRAEAYELAGRKQMPVEVIEGSLRDAIRYALKANAAHGLRRTNADKRNAVLTALADEEWSKLSARKIADLCGVSQPFVSKLMAERDNGYHSIDDQTPENQPVETSDSKIIKPITSGQIDELNDLFESMGDDEIDRWLAPYEVKDWGDLHASQAAELIFNMRSAASDRPPLSDPPQTNYVPDESPTERPSEECDPAGSSEAELCITLKGAAEDSWKSATLTLRGELATAWLECQEAVSEFEAAERTLSQRLDQLCRTAAFAREPALFALQASGSFDRWYCRDLRGILRQIKQQIPVAPCPHCIDTTNRKCAVCGGRRFVSKAAWDKGLLRPTEKLAMIESLEGSVA